MPQATTLVCDCCGLPMLPLEGEDCPRCHYPINMQKEMRFLEASIHGLRRVAEHGGVQLTVADLIGRYQSRLNYLRKVQERMTISAVQTQQAKENFGAEVFQSAIPIASVAAEDMVGDGQGAVPVIQAEIAPQRPERVFSFRTFLADQTINIIASLGAFIGLVGALSFVATTTNLWLSFLVLFLVQAVFGGVGIGAHRFASFRVVAIIYTVIFALLVPLVGFSGYRLALGHLIPLSAPMLLAIASLYAALVYGALAVYQRFKPFGYFGIVALAVAELALAAGYSLALWWWPAALMLLAFPASLALTRPAGSERPFIGLWAILREPVRIFACVVAGLDALGIVVAALHSLNLDSVNMPLKEVRLAILCMSVLLLLWACLALWLTMHTRWLPILAYLFLTCVLAFCYALDFRQVGYVLAFTLVALLYHGLNRLAPRLVGRFGDLPLQLDVLALALVTLAPVVALPLLPLQLLVRLYRFPMDALSPLYFRFGAATALECVAVALGFALTISVIVSHVSMNRTSPRVQANWRWLLLLNAVLFNWLYTVMVLATGIDPLRSFFSLAIVLLGVAVLVRQRFGTIWSHPLDVVVSGEIALTLLLSLSQSGDVIALLLLFFAVLLYAVLLYQRRYMLLAVSFCLALLALPILLERPRVLLVAALLLPLVAVAVRRFIAEKRHTQPGMTQKPPLFSWEWPLLATGLLYGLSISLLDTYAVQSTVQSWVHVPFPVALEVACYALVWYGVAALARMKLWLCAAIGFASAALLFPNNSFWALLAVTLVATVLAVGIKRWAGRVWALPLYGVALLSAVMTGYIGAIQHQSLTGYAVLACAALAFMLMLMERTPELLIFPAGLVFWAILCWQPPLSLALLVVACSLLCLLVFVSQFVWKVIRPELLWLPAPRFARLFGIGGQVMVVLAAILPGGLSTDAGWLAHAGVGALFVLALLLFWYGRLQSSPVVRRSCDYGSGLLAFLVISWELLAFAQTNLDLLALAPATYLIVIAPLLSHDALLSASLRRRLSQLVSLTGSILLLLPTFWLSFGSESANLLYTLILMGETLALLLLGIGVRMRMFVLIGAALLIVATLRTLFLPALGLPPSLALTVLGALLLSIATALSLARHRLQAVWVGWE